MRRQPKMSVPNDCLGGIVLAGGRVLRQPMWPHMSHHSPQQLAASGSTPAAPLGAVTKTVAPWSRGSRAVVACVWAGLGLARVICVLLLLALSLLVGGCKQRDACERACLRVARCIREAENGGALHRGQKPPPADAACMRKCSAQPEAFAKCEAIKRTCATMRDCHGPWR